MHGVEELGLLKMDFLGLRNLDVIEDTVQLIRATKDPAFDIDAVPLDDDPTLALLRKGDSIGVFQLEGGPMRALMRSLAPTSFDDVAALVALYRPGPMAANMHNDYADRKNGRKPVTYLHPDLEELLGDTYGLMIYQESVMRVAQKFAGYSLAEADNLRKACGKKIRELIAKPSGRSSSRAASAPATARELGTQLFDIIEPFADYAFNKSHAYGYGLVAYQTAYLKAHYPVEYLACLLTSVKASLEKAAVYLAECRAMGIKVLVPDVNLSAVRLHRPRRPRTAPPGGRCRPGARASSRSGCPRCATWARGWSTLILDERDAQRPLHRLLRLRRAGRPRGAQQAHHRVADQGRRLRLPRPSPPGPAAWSSSRSSTPPCPPARAGRRAVMSLFGDLGGSTDAPPAFDERVAIPDVEFDKAQRLAFEKEMLGPLRQRPPAAGRRGGAAPPHRLHDRRPRPSARTATW